MKVLSNKKSKYVQSIQLLKSLIYYLENQSLKLTNTKNRLVSYDRIIYLRFELYLYSKLIDILPIIYHNNKEQISLIRHNKLKFYNICKIKNLYEEDVSGVEAAICLRIRLDFFFFFFFLLVVRIKDKVSLHNLGIPFPASQIRIGLRTCTTKKRF